MIFPRCDESQAASLNTELLPKNWPDHPVLIMQTNLNRLETQTNQFSGLRSSECLSALTWNRLITKNVLHIHHEPSQSLLAVESFAEDSTLAKTQTRNLLTDQKGNYASLGVGVISSEWQCLQKKQV